MSNVFSKKGFVKAIMGTVDKKATSTAKAFVHREFGHVSTSSRIGFEMMCHRNRTEAMSEAMKQLENEYSRLVRKFAEDPQGCIEFSIKWIPSGEK